MEKLDRFETLIGIMDRLRDPGGCPWDREQSYETLRGFLVEECFEVTEALDQSDPEALREELGDLLFQIVFLARLASEEGHFGARDVIRGIAEKMIRRHPHVFGDDRVESSDEVLRNWEAIKRAEKGPAERGSLLDGLPRSLPALMKAQRLGDRAARVGFDWASPAEVLDKVEEELTELRSAVERGENQAARDELGDLLFSAAMLARHLRVDPEAALELTNRKFAGRFAWIEQRLAQQGRRPEELVVDELEQLWSEAKGGT